MKYLCRPISRKHMTTHDQLKDEALEAAVRVAPRVTNLKLVGQAVNDLMDIDWNSAVWTGLFRRNTAVKEQVLKVLGTEVRRSVESVTIEGNVRGAVVSDIHAPYHDKNAIALAIKALSKLDLDVLVDNGDALDFQTVGSYLTDPGLAQRIQDEIDVWHIEVASEFREKVRARRKFFLPGNHIGRMKKWLWANPGVYGLNSLEIHQMLELSRFGYEYVENEVFFGRALEVSHGTLVRQEAGDSAKAEARKRRFSISTITGHVHRAGRYEAKPPGYQEIIAQENPCLCTLKPEYARIVDWTHGFTLFEVKDGKVHIEPVKIYADYTCKVNGRWIGLD